MSDSISEDNNKKIKSTNDLIEDNEGKYCECDNKSYTFEISKEEKHNIENKESKLNKNFKKKENEILNDGEIIVTSIIECGEQEHLQGVKINLYKINGLSPVLIKSQTTDEEGKVIFSEVEDGCYRIIEIIDKRYFEKPKYINWNEIIIDSSNKKQKIVIINRIKKFVSQNKCKNWL